MGVEVGGRLAGLELPGGVKFAFQPAEELSNGANAMIADGVLDNPTVHAALGLHLWNELPVGMIGIAAGPVVASGGEFESGITGAGGHPAKPHRARHPLVPPAHVITALQTPGPRRPAPSHGGRV